MYYLEYFKIRSMQNEHYKENLKAALSNLVKVNASIYDSIIPIAMQGELKDFNDAVPIGEIHQFDFELFKNCDDTNIKMLVKIIEDVDAVYESIKNINGIAIEEEN